MLVLPEIKIRMAIRRLQKQRGEDIMHEYLFPVVAEMIGDIRSQTKWEDVALSYSLEEYSYYNRQYYRIYNTSELWAIEEFGQKPHLIPQPPHIIPSEKLYTWMDENGVPRDMHDYIQFYLHSERNPEGGWWIVHHPGTKGDYIAHNTFERYQPIIKERAQAAIAAMMQPVDYVEYGGY